MTKCSVCRNQSPTYCALFKITNPILIQNGPNVSTNFFLNYSKSFNVYFLIVFLVRSSVWHPIRFSYLLWRYLAKGGGGHNNLSEGYKTEWKQFFSLLFLGFGGYKYFAAGEKWILCTIIKTSGNFIGYEII